jgi:hypothetical protein
MKYNPLKVGVLILFIATSFNCSAAIIKVNNENKKAITLKLIPEGAPRDFVYEKEIPAENFFQFEVTAADLGGKSVFSLRGKTTPVTWSTCEHLSVDKNYTITFTNDLIGTTCVATDVAAPNTDLPTPK